MKGKILTIALLCLGAFGPLQFNCPAQTQQSYPQADHRPSSQSPVPLAKRAPPKDATATKGKTNENEAKPIRITQMPVDPWYIAYVIVTIVLVAVGGLGVWKAHQTLSSIQHQAIQMRRQTIIAIRSARTAQKSSEFSRLAVKSSERADILLESAKTIVYMGQTFDGHLEMIFRNFGRTRARIRSLGVRMIVQGVFYANCPAPHLPLVVVGAGQVYAIDCDPFRKLIPLKQFDDIVNGLISLQFEVWMVYQDVFGDHFTTRYVVTFEPPSIFRIEEQNAG
jgi:hypothetical protein